MNIISIILISIIIIASMFALTWLMLINFASKRKIKILTAFATLFFISLVLMMFCNDSSILLFIQIILFFALINCILSIIYYLLNNKYQ